MSMDNPFDFFNTPPDWDGHGSNWTTCTGNTVWIEVAAGGGDEAGGH